MNNGDEFDTPRVIERPVLNAANRALVHVLHNLALGAEAFPRALAAIARRIQMAPDPVGPGQATEIAKAIEEHAQAMAAGANDVKEAV